LAGNPKPSYFTAIRHRGGWPPRSSRSLLAATLTLLSGGFQLTLGLGMDFHLSPREHIVWRECGMNRRLKINFHAGQVGMGT
jgi:hypothetical protein